MNQDIKSLKEKIFSKDESSGNPLTGIFDVAREFGNIGDILGREFEVRNPKGKLLYVVKQRGLPIPQINYLLKELEALRKLEKAQYDKVNKSSKIR